MAALVAAAFAASGATPADVRLGYVIVATGLRQPVHVTAAPGEPDRLYAVERAGRVRIVEEGRVLTGSFLDIRPRVRSEGLLGLSSIVFHPRYASNRRLYAMFTGGSGGLYVIELREREGRARPVRTMFSTRISKSAYAHAGGQLAFGPGGQLLASVGDGLDPEAAQDRESPLGKVLRFDVDRPRAAPGLVAMGLRNPWRLSFDRLTGDLFIGDVGEEDWEEINVVRRGSGGIPNFGWGVEPPPADAERPLVRYAHPTRGCAAVIGGQVYRGSEIPSARGRYFFGDTCSGRVWSIRAASGSPAKRLERFTVPGLASFGEDAAGELLLVSRSEGAVAKLVHR